MALDYKSYAPFVKKAQEVSSGIKNYALSKTPSMSAGLSVGNMVKRKTSTSKSSLGTETTSYGGSTRYEKFHPGVDIANSIGTPIPSMTAGTVVEAVTGRKQGDRGYGNYVVIKDQQGNLHRYSHLNDEYVKVGDPVEAGQVFSSMGNSGSAYSTHGGTGSHLDYRVVDLAGKYLDPYQFLK